MCWLKRDSLILFDLDSWFADRGTCTTLVLGVYLSLHAIAACSPQPGFDRCGHCCHLLPTFHGSFSHFNLESRCFPDKDGMVNDKHLEHNIAQRNK